jgi:hypothetical protein
MSEKEMAQHFNQNLDRFLNGTVQEPVSEYSQEDQELLALASELQTMTDKDLSRRKRAQQKRLLVLAAEQNISSAPQGRKAAFPARKLRLSAVLLALIVLIAASVAFREPLTVLAQEILYQIGIWEIDNEPTSVEIHLQSTPRSTPEPTPDYGPGFTPESGFIFRNLSVEQVEAESGLSPILVAGYLPEGFERILRDNYIVGYELRVETLYLNPEDLDNLLTFSQIRLLSEEELEKYDHLPYLVVEGEDPGPPNVPADTWGFYTYDFHGEEDDQGALPFSVGDAPVVEVTVRNRPGVWIEQTNWGFQTSSDLADQQPQPLGMNFLIWEEDGFTMWLKSFNMPLSEMLKVAEGLHLSSETE